MIRVPAFAMTIMVALMSADALASPQLFAKPGDVKELFAVRSLKCTFPWYASAEWESDTPKLKTASQAFEFQIDGINLRDRVARLIGNAGSADLNAHRGADSITFTEQTLMGSLHTTTVFAFRDSQGRFKVVHSRHPIINGPSPSQNYGFCQVW